MASFQELEHWYTEAIENCTEDAVFALIGAQKDREF
jgi:GTPase SAR1 family protein